MMPFTIGAAILRLLGRKSVAPRWLTALAFIFALVAVLLALWGAWQAFDWFNDRDAVEDAANEANAEFGQSKDEATGNADLASGARTVEHRTRIKQTEELIDEALQNGCVVADYLASNGADCVQPPAGIPRPAAQ